MVLALAQVDPTLGNFPGNVALVLEARAEAGAQGADIAVFSELVVTGYPPEDLISRPAFIGAAGQAVGEIARATADEGPAIIVGAPVTGEGGVIHNAALLIADGEVKAIRRKQHLPNYGVFDEQRVFAPGPPAGPVRFRDVNLGIMVCEDMWHSDVSETLAESGADLLIVINGSPFDARKADQRLSLAVARVSETSLPLVYVNQIGGQDELAFDGASFVLSGDARLTAQAPSWEASVLCTTWQPAKEDGAWGPIPAKIHKAPEGEKALWQAMVTGLRGYVEKNRFPGIVLGLSGGIDSALSAAIAVDAIGGERVRGVRMPSAISSQGSLDDAEETAQLLSICLETVPISSAVEALGVLLKEPFQGREADVTEENLQARLRGTVLMAFSNKFGELLLTTGNKSEMSVGYATIYGDMNGGFSVLKDVYKTTAYQLARWRNEDANGKDFLGPDGKAIPEASIEKPPTAELRPGQTDQDLLPDYEILDAVLERLVEKEQSVDEVVASGADREIIEHVRTLLFRAEYKRRQAPPGVRLTSRAFGRDRRYPITNAFALESGSLPKKA